MNKLMEPLIGCHTCNTKIQAQYDVRSWAVFSFVKFLDNPFEIFRKEGQEYNISEIVRPAVCRADLFRHVTSATGLKITSSRFLYVFT